MAWGIPTLWTLIRVLGGTFIGGFLVTAGLLYRYQNALIYPSSFPNGSRTNVLTPDEFDLEYEDVRLKTPDGQELRVYLMCQSESSEREKRRGEDEGDVATRRPTILFLHANAGNMGHRLPLAAVFFKRFGCNVLMLSYRGYGLSTGTPSEKGIRIDAQTALNYIKRHPRLKATHVVAYGQSIGGAVAVDLAAKAGHAISALILENTFLSIPELIPHVLPPVKPFTFLCREFWPTGDSIMQLGPYQPVLFLSGRADELVPPSHMDLLFKRCSSSKKVWKSFKDGTHNDTCVKPGYFEAIAQFLATWVVPLTQGISPAELPDPDAHGTLPSPRTAEAALAPHSSYSKGGERSGDASFGSFGGFSADSGSINPSGVGGVGHTSQGGHARQPSSPRVASQGPRLRRSASASSADSRGSLRDLHKRDEAQGSGAYAGSNSSHSSFGTGHSAAAQAARQAASASSTANDAAAAATAATAAAAARKRSPAGSRASDESEWVEMSANDASPDQAR